MALQYWVGDFFVDLSRNQVTQKQESQTIAPKALAVLTYLAENQKRVVSYDELFDNVWPNTVVTPNTLQRCIAQLRKVLSANDTTNSYIKTHAKQGYSLECDVRWQHESEVNTALHEPIKIAVKEDNITDDKSSESSSNITNNRISINSKTLVNYIFNVFSLKIFTLTILALTVITWILLGYPNSVFKNGSNSKPLVFDQLRSLTATDDKEYSAIYSPNGRYIVFHRYVDKLCKNNLWAKDLSTQQEFQLLDKIGTYGDHSFSPDGNKLAFIASQDCEQPVTQQRCYHLKSLNFNQSLTSPQSATLIVECKNSELKQPIWLDDENI